VKVDLKIASITLRKSENPAPVRMAKLRIVERFIEKHQHVGSIRSPGREYFRGQMGMQWGWLTGSRGPLPIVFFRSEERRQEVIQVVMLAGSRRHVIGESPDAEAVAYSSLPHIIAAIGDYISDESVRDEQRSQSPELALRYMTRIKIMPPNTPVQNVEFLAVPLAESTTSSLAEGTTSWHVVLGTPLYVALAPEIN
jgi:hypothetical protein